MTSLIYDSFHDADNTAIAAHTPEIGGPWTSVDVGLKIVGNKLTGSDAQGTADCAFSPRKFCQLEAAFDLNGMAGGSQLYFTFDSDPGEDDQLSIAISGDGSLQVNCYGRGGSDVHTNSFISNIAAGTLHVARLVVGPQRCLAFYDGMLLANVQRGIARSQLLAYAGIYMSVSSGNYPKVSWLRVNG